MKGCLGLVVLFFALAGGEYALLGWTPLSGSFGLPLVSSGSIVLSLASLWGTLLVVKRRRALGVSPDRWSDGAFVGFSGRITSEGVPLAAPGSSRMAAIYDYALKSSRRRGDHQVETTYFQGMGMAGCRVQSGAYTFRLIGFPLLTQVPKERLSDAASLGRIAAHLLRSDVQPKPASVGASLRSLGDVLADADGIVRVDQAAHAELDLRPYRERYATDSAAAAGALAAALESERCFVEETIVPESAEVVVYGAYRSADRTIDVGSGMEDMARGLSLGAAGATSRSELVRSAVALLVIVGATIAFHRWIVPPLLASRTVERYRGQGLGFDDAIGAALRRGGGHDLVILAQSDDAPAIVLLTGLGADANLAGSDIRPLQQAGRFSTVKALLDGGADPNFSGHQGNAPLHRFAERGDLATVRLLLAHGAAVDPVDDWGNTPLERAAVHGHVEVGRVLLEAKADANHRAKDGSTPLDEARANGNDEFARLLQTVGGARETEVTASTGRPVTLGDPPVRLLQAYEDALRGHDTASIAVLKPATRGYDWSTTDWDALLGGRPVRFTEAVGYAAPERATLRVRGPTADGRPRGLTLGFALARDRTAATSGPLAAYDGWSIEREWIEWGELKARR